MSKAHDSVVIIVAVKMAECIAQMANHRTYCNTSISTVTFIKCSNGAGVLRLEVIFCPYWFEKWNLTSTKELAASSFNLS